MVKAEMLLRDLDSERSRLPEIQTGRQAVLTGAVEAAGIVKHLRT
jgi:hypothetical protein